MLYLFLPVVAIISYGLWKGILYVLSTRPSATEFLHKEEKEYKTDLCYKKIDRHGNIRTYNKNTQLHSFNDEPAVIYRSGNKVWYKEGQLHRDNELPAIEFANGTKQWYKEGQLYIPLCRKETDEDGAIRTYNKLTNELHSFNDEPAVIHDGDKYWCKEGKSHRDSDLPAVEFANGYKAWYKDGLLHRDNDLPAAEYPNGNKYWYKNGEEYIPDLCRKETDANGVIRTYNKNNQLHSFNDEPALIHPAGLKYWCKEGVLHRDNDLPAYISIRNKYYYKQGKEYHPNFK